MRIHLVGGFLGSGKTTAIAGAAKILMAQGLRVGVVTNDQGRYLVDTAFVRLLDVPAVEVTGGCFCCNYDDFETRIIELQDTQQPDVIFAESVGSCADVVATVVKPLLNLRGMAASFSVFADARLLLRHLRGEPLPFSDNVVYIYEKQLEEAGLLIINKVDLLAAADAKSAVELAARRFPDKTIRQQNSLDPTSLRDWLGLLAEQPAPVESLDINYARYGAGEADLAWLDEKVRLRGGRSAVLRAVNAIMDALTGEAIGHLKFVIEAGDMHVKISRTTLADDDWRQLVPDFGADDVYLLINARVQMSADALREVVEQALVASGIDWTADEISYFHPAHPSPTHRIS